MKVWAKETLEFWGKVLGEQQVLRVQDIVPVPDFDAFDIIFKDGHRQRISGQQIERLKNAYS